MIGYVLEIAYAGAVPIAFLALYRLLMRHERASARVVIDNEVRMVFAVLALILALVWPIVLVGGAMKGPFFALLRRFE